MAWVGGLGDWYVNGLRLDSLGVAIIGAYGIYTICTIVGHLT